MNDKAFENKVDRDLDNLNKDFATLGDDSITGLSRMFEQMADDVKETVADAVEAINQTVGQGLSQYNVKVQDAVDKVPGGFSEKAARYPWVTLTFALATGLLLGVLLKPGRQHVG